MTEQELQELNELKGKLDTYKNFSTSVQEQIDANAEPRTLIRDMLFNWQNMGSTTIRNEIAEAMLVAAQTYLTEETQSLEDEFSAA